MMFARLCPVFWFKCFNACKDVVCVKGMLTGILEGRRCDLLPQAVNAYNLDKKCRWAQHVRKDKGIQLVNLFEMLLERLSDTDLTGRWTEAVGEGDNAIQCQLEIF